VVRGKEESNKTTGDGAAGDQPNPHCNTVVGLYVQQYRYPRPSLPCRLLPSFAPFRISVYMEAAAAAAARRKAIWAIWLAQADLLVTASTFLSGLSFTALFTVAENYQTVRVFFLTRSLSWCSYAIFFGQLVFVFALLMVLGGLLRYSIQAFHVAGEVISIVATSIAIGAVLAVLVPTGGVLAASHFRCLYGVP